MFHQIQLRAIFSLLCLTCLCSATSSNTNFSTLNTVFMKEVSSTTLGELLHYKNSLESNLSSTCFGAKDNKTIIKSCLVGQCLSPSVVAELYGVSLDSPLGEENLTQVVPAVLYTLNQRSSCSSTFNMTSNARPSQTAVWGYSFLFVTLINLCSLTGILVLPCMKKAIYSVILMFMVALAVGTLVGSSVLVLIPEAFELVHVGGGGEEEHEGGDSYIWISTSVMGGIYLFFLIERVMRIINGWRENTKEKKRQDELATRGTLTSSFTRKAPSKADIEMKNPANLHLEESPSSNCLCGIEASNESQDNPDKSSCHSSHGNGDLDGADAATLNGVDAEVEYKKDNESDNSKGALIQSQKGVMNGHSHHGHSHHDNHVAPVAYMVIFGDGFHNFIDGLSIGAAFTDSILLGISVSVAVICEELPHELGDFAILLNAGMRLRRALMYNFLSSLMCYFGLVLGILVGENTTAHTWIFGVAGGMFLYIALVDMMPEMNSAAESEVGNMFGMMRTFLVQNVGLLTGYSIILFMSLYGSAISFE